jgi:hypothetical protein
MKKAAAFLAFFVFATLAVLPAFAQGPQPIRKVVYSLEPGEQFLQPESAIFISATKESVILVLSRGKRDRGSPFFVFKDGSMKGPFKKLNDVMLAAYEGQDQGPGIARDCAAYFSEREEQSPDAAPQVSEDGGGQTVVFNGKTYGPYKAVYDVRGMPDGSRAYFMVADKGKKWFICSDGRKVQIDGSPKAVMFSQDGKNALAGSLIAQRDLFIYTIDGQKFGPFGEDMGEPWFPAGSNNFFFLIGNQLYMNGTPTLKVEQFDPCDFYPSADGKRYALFTYENLVFSDGMKYPFPLNVVSFQEKEQTIIRWVALENDKDIVVYQRAI